ncbi:MCE family protein [Nocardioides sp. Soil796]|uniref:MCE family protein n=1 Tax=Nocardioides sp. Soil796 TaxID=1736412 RepID=UPI00070A3302|nr:MCE family protein [Nocardioides sp. Soil796]KRF14506.1 hypothetical protein ASH02_09265 [Nocardioides sp. Soil796]
MKLVKRIAVIVIALALVTAAIVVGAKAWFKPEPTKVEALFESTVGLYPGSDVQILGVPVGHVTAVDPEGDLVRVSMEIDEDQEVGADTAAVIVAPTLVSDRFVQLTEPYDGGAKLASGDEIPRERTAVPVEIDDLYKSLNDVGKKLGPEGANKDGALADLLEVAAANLDGQGTNLNTMISEFSKATATLSKTDTDFFSTVTNLEKFNDMLVANDRTVGNVNQQFAAVTDYLADDRDDLTTAVTNLGDALVILDDFIRDNRGNLKSSVSQLVGPTKVLVNQKKSLEESVRLIPLVLQNYLKAYDPKSNTLQGRGNLNELTLWSKNGLDSRTSSDAPPNLLPGVGETR